MRRLYMALENLISIAIPPDTKQQAIDGIKSVDQLLTSFLHPLSDTQRANIAKVSDGTEPYMSKINSYVTTNPEFAPSFMDVSEFKKDYLAYADCLDIIKPLKQLLSKLEDTKTLCGSEGYTQSLLYYHSAKQAAKNGVANSKVIYDDLKKRFPSNPHKEEPAQAPPEQA